jgi:DNA-binding transcriptional LysR family regulator
VQYFVAVAEELHFGRAAARLHIAQPSLSQQIRQLEQQLGVMLLERTSRSVELTPAGESLLEEGRRLLAQAQRVVATVRSAAAKRLTVGFYGSAARTVLPEALREFNARHPSVDVTVRELLLDRIDEIREGHVDVAFTRLLPGQADLEIEVIGREARVVALSADHPLAERDSISFEDLRDASFIINPVTQDGSPPPRWLAEQHRHGLPGRVAAQSSSIQEILTLVGLGRGVCLVPEPVARDHPRQDVRYIVVTNAEPAVVSLAWTQETFRGEVSAFVETVREVAKRNRPRR